MTVLAILKGTDASRAVILPPPPSASSYISNIRPKGVAKALESYAWDYWCKACQRASQTGPPES